MAVVGVEAAELQFDDRGAGWRWFAAILMGLAGVLRLFDAVWAFRYKGANPKSLSATLLGDSIHRYGWLYLVVGIVLIVAAGGVLTRSQVGRWIGIVAAFLAAVTAGLWLPVYPIWSLAYLGLSLLVIWALGVHGGPAAAADAR